MIHRKCYLILILSFLFSIDFGSPVSAQLQKQDARAKPKTILFFGNSLSAGYGVQPEQAFPALIQQKIDSLGWNFDVVNAGLGGETTSGGLGRIDWVLRRKIDIFILELGGNDMLRGVSPDLTRKNLHAIIDKVRKKYPDVEIVLAGMQAPPNFGEAYTKKFRSIYTGLAEENDIHLIPFLLDGVGGIPELNLPDGIHPTPKGHEIVAENVWHVLKPVISKLRLKN